VVKVGSPIHCVYVPEGYETRLDCFSERGW
jgi:hypothetical protein